MTKVPNFEPTGSPFQPMVALVAPVLALALSNAAAAASVPSVKLRDGTYLPMATLGGG